ncbi:MAG: HAD family phosphatase [Paracoccaceae bacterium]
MRAVIFDMDGCLVDSESMALDTLAGLMAERGAGTSPADLRRDVLGLSIQTIAAMVARRSSQAGMPDFAASFEERLLERYEQGLALVPGAADLLAGLQARGTPMAIATGSSLRRMHAALRLTGLDRLFQGRAVSAEQVARGKPAPDIFLFAAERLGIAPEGCAVMEDSPHGIAGARAAGMRAVGFTGGSHLDGARDDHARLLREAGAVAVLDDLSGMADALLPALAQRTE